MTFNPLAALNCVEITKKLENIVKVVDIGSQTPSIGIYILDIIVKRFKFLNHSQRKNIENIKYKIQSKKTITTKDFFMALNFSVYHSIDVNNAYGSLPFDLNLDLIEEYKYHEVYDLVINNGTGEHIFNQYSLFKNIHQLCEKGGIMLHILPFIDWINHGFYNYNPIFFADLAASNNYQIIKMALANRNGNEIIINRGDYYKVYEQIKPKTEKSFFLKAIDLAKEKLGKNIIIVIAYKKVNNKNFIIPMQGKYLADLNDNSLKNYKNQNTGSEKGINQLADRLKRK